MGVHMNFMINVPRIVVVREIIESCNAHMKKYGIRKMSIKELDGLCGANNQNQAHLQNQADRNG